MRPGFSSSAVTQVTALFGKSHLASDLCKEENIFSTEPTLLDSQTSTLHASVIETKKTLSFKNGVLLAQSVATFAQNLGPQNITGILNNFLSYLSLEKFSSWL